MRAYHEREVNRYRSPLRVRLEHTYVKGKSAESLSVAKEIAQGKGGERGDEFAMPIGNEWVPLSMVSQRLGSSVARKVRELFVGESSAPIESTAGYHVVRLLETRGGEVLPFERARENVRADYERDRGDEALRTFLERQRKRADIEMGDP